MLKRASTTDIISISIYLLINCLFVFKYSSRFFEYPILLTIFYAFVILAFIFLCEKELIAIRKISAKAFLIFICITAVIILAVILLTADLKIRVGRYEAINNWIENFLIGKFPYGNHEYHNPASFPILFLLLIPFYLLGNVGLFQLISFLIFSYLLYQRKSKSSVVTFSLLILAPIFWYEVVAKSELFSNMVLALALIYIAEMNYEKIKSSTKTFVTVGILSGLLLSTRSIILVILILFFAFIFRNDLMKFVQFFTITIVTFIITIIPFYFWSPSQFIEKGPFAIQSIYLHPILVVSFLIIAFIVGWKSKSAKNIYFKIALLLFLIVTVSFIQKLFEYSLTAMIFNDRFDIAYFTFPLPFLLFDLDTP
ncbi:MAG: hypothetical protein N3A61_00415, partial [Ignavibacteria bacterium]|nr:hypothetical protein [Ignavibacteria bacterium]